MRLGPIMSSKPVERPSQVAKLRSFEGNSGDHQSQHQHTPVKHEKEKLLAAILVQ